MCSKIPVTDSGAFTVTPPGADVIFNEAALSVPSDSSIVTSPDVLLISRLPKSVPDAFIFIFCDAVPFNFTVWLLPEKVPCEKSTSPPISIVLEGAFIVPLFTKFLFTVISLFNVKTAPVSTSIFAKVQRVEPVLKLALPVNFKVPVPFPPVPAPKKPPAPIQFSVSSFNVTFSNSTPPCIVNVFASESAVIETVFREGIVTSSFIVGMPVGLQFAAVCQSPPEAPIHI